MSLKNRESFEKTHNPDKYGYPEPIRVTGEHKIIGDTGICVWLEYVRENGHLKRVMHVRNEFYNKHPPVWMVVWKMYKGEYINAYDTLDFRVESGSHDYVCSHKQLEGDDVHFFITSVYEIIPDVDDPDPCVLIWDTNCDTKRYFNRVVL